MPWHHMPTVFTNLTREHLDYHGDMQAYAQAKARLFSGLRPGAAAVLNLDDPAAPVMRSAAEAAGARVVTYSARQAADLSASRLRTDLEGSRLNLDGMGISTTELRLPLRGRYNVENALAAAVAARSAAGATHLGHSLVAGGPEAPPAEAERGVQ